MTCSGNSTLLLPRLILFFQAIIGIRAEGVAAGIDHAVLITDRDVEVIKKVPTESHRR